MRITDKHVLFWRGIYSNWYPSEFTLYDITFNCVEQYMMFRKAMLFHDTKSADKILATNEPDVQKFIGRHVRGFDAYTWQLVCRESILPGLIEKFRCRPDLKEHLLRDGKNRHFAEASPYDAVWGIGMGENDYGVDDSNNWQGKNYLGLLLDEVYTIMENEE